MSGGETAHVLDQGGIATFWLGEHHFWYSGDMAVIHRGELTP